MRLPSSGPAELPRPAAFQGIFNNVQGVKEMCEETPSLQHACATAQIRLQNAEELFFGRLIARPRWHARFFVYAPLLGPIFLQRFPRRRAAFGPVLIRILAYRMPERISRVRAARRWGESKEVIPACVFSKSPAARAGPQKKSGGSGCFPRNPPDGLPCSFLDDPRTGHLPVP